DQGGGPVDRVVLAAERHPVAARAHQLVAAFAFGGVDAAFGEGARSTPEEAAVARVLAALGGGASHDDDLVGVIGERGGEGEHPGVLGEDLDGEGALLGEEVAAVLGDPFEVFGDADAVFAGGEFGEGAVLHRAVVL